MNDGVKLRFTVDELAQQARDVSGIDLVDHAAVEPLEVICRSLNGEACLHNEGAREQERKLLRILATRLRMQRDIAAHPEILDQTIDAPIIVCGMARTGSTKTQKLLASTGDFNWLPFWQSINPASRTGVPHEDVSVRIAETDEYVRWFDAASPEAKTGHEFETLEPDEESWILEHSLHSPVFQGWSTMWGYLEWLYGTSDITCQFTYLRDALKYLQWQGLQDPAKRWVLKCPLYVGTERELLTVFPDAKLVMTHRSPLETAPSTCKLSNLFYAPHTNKMTECDVAIGGFAQQMKNHLDFRHSQPADRFLDIYYQDLITKEAEVLERIYRFADLPLSSETKQKALDWSRNNPKNKKGTFRYSLEEFGFSEERVREMFVGYSAYLETLR